MTQRRHWADYRTTEYHRIDPQETIAILPVAAIEQHGPHLPVGVDTMINQGMLDTLCARLPDDLDVRILPIQAIGKSNEHLHAPGTLTLPAELVIQTWLEIGLSVARAGIRKLAFINSHGGNVEVIGIVARELRVRAQMLATKLQWSAFGHPDGLYSTEELKYGIHGGDIETSLMLHFRPELVAMDQARHFHSSAQEVRQGERLAPTGPTAYAWIASDLNPHGTVGDAASASAQKGQATAEHQVDGFVAYLREMAAFDIARLD